MQRLRSAAIAASSTSTGSSVTAPRSSRKKNLVKSAILIGLYALLKATIGIAQDSALGTTSATETPWNLGIGSPTQPRAAVDPSGIVRGVPVENERVLGYLVAQLNRIKKLRADEFLRFKLELRTELSEPSRLDLQLDGSNRFRLIVTVSPETASNPVLVAELVTELMVFAQNELTSDVITNLVNGLGLPHPNQVGGSSHSNGPWGNWASSGWPPPVNSSSLEGSDLFSQGSAGAEPNAIAAQAEAEPQTTEPDSATAIGLSAGNGFPATSKSIPFDGYATQLSVIETIANAAAGNAQARFEILKYRRSQIEHLYQVLESSLFVARLGPSTRVTALREAARIYGVILPDRGSFKDLLRTYREARLAQLDARIEDVRLKSDGQYSVARRTYLMQSRRAKQGPLIDLQTFRDLAQQGRRDQIADLFEEALPFAMMSPFEAGAWNRWVGSMRAPGTPDLILYRGLDEKDFDALASNQSPVFVANLFRRHSLSAERAIVGYHLSRIRAQQALDRGNSTPKISSMLQNHASSASGSPFLSFTDSIESALNFAAPGGGLLAIRVDPRRVIWNFYNVEGENEILVPLLVFPDEIALLERIPRRADSANGNSTEIWGGSLDPIQRARLKAAAAGKGLSSDGLSSADFKKRARNEFADALRRIPPGKCAEIFGPIAFSVRP